MSIVTIIYLVANIAYFAVLTPIEMLSSTAVAVVSIPRKVESLKWLCKIYDIIHRGVFPSLLQIPAHRSV